MLTQLLQDAGVSNIDAALACLNDQECIKEYEEGLKTARSKGQPKITSNAKLIEFISLSTGIGGVPFFEIYLPDSPDMRQQFSGAQPIDTFVAIFNRLRVVAKV